MKTLFRFLLLSMPMLAALVLALSPGAAEAQPKSRLRPVISQFDVQQSDQLTPGSDLDFSVEGTPGAQVTVRLSGVNKAIVLREIEGGVYEGSYTLSRRDQLGTKPVARATLKARNVSVVASQALSTAPAAAAAVKPAAPVAAAPAPAPQAAGLPVIERFLVSPVPRIEPGAELRFAVTGTPGARVTLSIESVVQGLVMNEVRPGRYEGAYTIRRNDAFPPSLNIVANLESNGQAVRSRLNQALIVDARPPTIRNLAPRDNESVPGNVLSVSATFDDSGGVGVDPKTARFIIGTQDVTRNATVTAQSITWRGQLSPGTYPVEISVSDLVGNSVRQAWVFTVVGAQAQPAAALPLEITNHANNAQVGKGSVEIRGRTAPDTQLDIQVQAIAALAGMFGINQQIYKQTLRSDASGNFGFTFQPQIPVPGARYETTINATKGEMSKELKLVLFQQN